MYTKINKQTKLQSEIQRDKVWLVRNGDSDAEFDCNFQTFCFKQTESYETTLSELSKCSWFSYRIYTTALYAYRKHTAIRPSANTSLASRVSMTHCWPGLDWPAVDSSFPTVGLGEDSPAGEERPA